MITLFGKQGRDLPQREWSHAVRFEVACLRADRSVGGRVRVRTLPDGSLAILLPVTTDVVLEPECEEIGAVEPFAFVYKDAAVGVNAPAIFSDRETFPRSLAHLNPVPDDSPVSICLAREGLQPLYEREGITGVLTRLRTWLCDAKTGSLQYDGWEPVPSAADAGIGVLDGARFQEFAKTTGETPGWAWGLAFLLGRDSAFGFIPHEGLTLSNGNFEHACRAMEERGLFEKGSQHVTPVPVVFLWQPASASTGDPVFRHYRTGAEFQQDLRQLGLAQRFDLALGEMLISGWKKTAERPWEVVAVVGVTRPKLIIRDRVGLSKDQEAGRLEIKAFLLEAEKREGVLSETARVREISLMAASNREILTDVSGVEPTRSPCLIGCGALGSEIGDFLTRMGVEKMTFVDGERLLPHNLPRHVGVATDLLTEKAIVLARREEGLLPGGTPTFIPIVKDVRSLDPSEEAHVLRETDFLIDATASDRVRRRLPSLARRLGKRIVRQELFDGGRLGVQGIEGEAGNPDLLDLYHTLCRLALEDEAVSAWLRRERDGIGGLETIAAGFSCSSPSFRIPKWRVAAHATAFMPALTRLVEGRRVTPGLGLNVLSEDGHPMGFKWIDVAAFDVREARGTGWKVRVGPGVYDELRRLARQHAPNETGGYLYGGFDLDLRRITVTIATPQPKGTVGTPSALRLGKAGGTTEEAIIRRHCGTRIAIVGTWHSHPGGNARLSDRDERTAASFRRENRHHGLPTLLMVCGARGVGVYVPD